MSATMNAWSDNTGGSTCTARTGCSSLVMTTSRVWPRRWVIECTCWTRQNCSRISLKWTVCGLFTSSKWRLTSPRMIIGQGNVAVRSRTSENSLKNPDDTSSEPGRYMVMTNTFLCAPCMYTTRTSNVLYTGSGTSRDVRVTTWKRQIPPWFVRKVAASSPSRGRAFSTKV